MGGDHYQILGLQLQLQLGLYDGPFRFEINVNTPGHQMDLKDFESWLLCRRAFWNVDSVFHSEH